MRAPSLTTDPGWQRLNNRGRSPCRTVVQDFGWHRNRIGGVVTRATRPAFYGAVVERDLDAPFSASGRLVVHGIRPQAAASGVALVGFFRHDISQWRAPDSLLLRVSTGDVGDGAYAVDLEYGSHNLRAGGAVVPRGPSDGSPRAFRFGERYPWEIAYTPVGDHGLATLRIGDAPPLVVRIPSRARHDGARLDRFGLATANNGAGVPVSLDIGRVTLDGVRQDLLRDPAWDGDGNRSRFRDCQTGPRASHFGWTGPTGRSIGGIVWRTDERHPAQRAFYADRTSRLTLEDPLAVRGTMQLRRANTDSAVLLGWFAARSSGGGLAQSSPPNFLGLKIDGPTRTGLQVAPLVAPRQGRPRSAKNGIPITPGRRRVPFLLRYHPRRGHAGRIDLEVGGEKVSLKLDRRLRRTGAVFDRFGLRSVERGGSWQELYLTDLRYTVAPTRHG